MYYGEFTCLNDIVSNFNITNQKVDDMVVLFAAYNFEYYDGFALVIYVQNGKFYIVEGSHCSCFGLEDQWNPDEMPIEALLHMADKGLGMLNDYKSEFKDSLRIVQELGLVEVDPSDAQLALKLAFG